MPDKHKKILKQLNKLYPDPKCELDHDGPFQLLIATILSAQCTDVRVNKVTPALFKAYPDAFAMAKAPLESIEDLIRTTGFFRNKAKSILETSQILVEKYKGQVPKTMQALIKLKGVGRKTANVILGNAFNINEGVVVDTHVGRLSRRFGFTKEKDPIKVEKDLMKLVPQKDWTIFSHWLILHGRRVCKAQRPLCGQCELAPLCPSASL
ncbi:MAG TPA: endonuclease III [Oligoflexia bacterium]|nr:endonuclease III [Oligoflexia bacterium]HMR23791.1 endonuclease III [Oligoflexia bacterium]